MTVVVCLVVALVATLFCIMCFTFPVNDWITREVACRINTRYKIRQINKILKTNNKHTVIYSGAEDMNAIATYYIKKGYVVDRGKYGWKRPTIYARRHYEPIAKTQFTKRFKEEMA